MLEKLSLNGSDWQFKDFTGEDWRWRNSHKPGTRDRRWWRMGSVPGCPPHDLWQLGEIPNPYYERNSLLIEWIPQRTWLYKKTFQVPDGWQGQSVRLCFEGVDYQAEFFLNGESLGSHTGMYTPVAFEVGDRLLYEEPNLVAVVIEAAPYEQPQVGRTSRVTTHKSRMTYWWDFCPRMVHQGIWDDVYLERAGEVRIEQVWVRPHLDKGLSHALVEVLAVLEAAFPDTVEIDTEISFNGEVVARQTHSHSQEVGQNQVAAVFEIDRPRLWWPNGYGEQPLYQAHMRVKRLPDGQETDRACTTFGIRSLELAPNEDADPSALPYTLVVNGRRIYIKGWNWVPIDVMYGVPRPEKMEHLLGLAQKAHVNLLRVWGGGLIETEAFYNLCDRLGLLVWQEFIQSSSGIDNLAPDSEAFIGLITGEARQIIPRKRNHPSLAVWCGGNELQRGPEAPLDSSHPTLAALQAIVNELDPGRPWLPTSSSGPIFSNSLENIQRNPSQLHDVHGPWEYQGVTRQYELYNQGASLLHSEFGVEGITNLKTLNAIIAPERQLPVDLDNPYWWHLAAWWVKRPMWVETFGELEEIEKWVQATQFMQASGLQYALEADRRRKYHNSGTLPWQFNEPYPMAACTSAVDYYGRPKPVYYAVAQAYVPLSVTAKVPTAAWEGREQFEAELWACSSFDQTYRGILHARLVGAAGELLLEESCPALCEPDRAARLAHMQWPLAELLSRRKPASQAVPVFFLDLLLSGANGAKLAHNRYVFSLGKSLAPLLDLPPTQLAFAHTRQGQGSLLAVTNTGRTADVSVWLEDGREVRTSTGYAVFSDNYFCLFPGETRQVVVRWSEVPLVEQKIEISGLNVKRQVLG